MLRTIAGFNNNLNQIRYLFLLINKKKTIGVITENKEAGPFFFCHNSATLTHEKKRISE
jgi:hypothetical protein